MTLGVNSRTESPVSMLCCTPKSLHTALFERFTFNSEKIFGEVKGATIFQSYTRSSVFHTIVNESLVLAPLLHIPSIELSF